MKNKRMRVLWFCNTPANGAEYLGMVGFGSGTWLAALDKALQDRIELHIAFYHEYAVNFSVGSTHYWAIARYKNKIEKLFKKFSERFFDGVIDDDHLEYYLKIINKVQPDLIHIHGSENSFGCIVDNTDIPVVVSIQGLICSVLESYFRGLDEKYSKLRNFKLDTFKNIIFPTNFNNTQLKFSSMAEIERKNLKKCKNIIGRTEWDFRVTRVLAPDSKYYHGDEIMREEFFSKKWFPLESSSKKVVIHTTADNVYYKGLETIVGAINNLKKLGVNCTWRIAGVKPDDLIVRVLIKKFKKNYPTDSIVFLGKLSSDNLINSMLSADCYVLTSNIENSPNALCEAMLLGMPCVATCVGGVSTFIRNNKNGFLVQPGDSFSVAACVVEVISNPMKAQALGAVARDDALRRHNSSRVVTELLSAYREIVSS